MSGMDRIWQWAWDRYGARYSWAICAIWFALSLPIYLFVSFVVVAFEESDRYVEAAAVTVVAMLVLAYVMVLPGLGRLRLVEQWAAGHEVDRARALDATYTYARGLLSDRWGPALLARAAFRRRRRDRRGDRVAAGPVRDSGRRLGSRRPSCPPCTASWKQRCGRPGSPSPVTRGSATPCPALARLLPRGRTLSMLAAMFIFTVGGRDAGGRVRSGQRDAGAHRS